MKRILIVFAVILLLLIITNPSVKRFKDFIGSNSSKGLRRTSNWVLFSYYKDNTDDKYFGILLNFFHINNTFKNENEIKEDSTAVSPDTTSINDINTNNNKKMDDSDFNKVFDEAIKKSGIK